MQSNELLASYACHAQSDDPALRMAAVLADVLLLAGQQTVTAGCAHAASEELTAAATELVEQRPYLRRLVDDVVPALQALLESDDNDTPLWGDKAPKDACDLAALADRCSDGLTPVGDALIECIPLDSPAVAA